MELLENGNHCMVYYKRYPDPTQSPYAIAPFSVVYVTLFVLGLAGNTLLIYVTLKNKTLQTVQNIFILNMAASDVMMCLLSLPITPVTNIYKNWYFGAVLCHLIPCIQGVSIFVCTFSLGAIAMDRFILVVCPHARPLSRRGAFVTTIALWVISFIVTIPYAIYMKMEQYAGICGYFCTEEWPSAASRRAYTLVVMVFQFVVPFACMAFCYLCIFFVLSRRARIKLRRIDERSMALEQSCVYRPQNGVAAEKEQARDESMNIFFDKQEKERQRLINQTRRTTSILVSMVVWFGLTWLPHNTVSLMIEYDQIESFFAFISNADINYLLNLFTHCFAMSNIVVNPILYAWLNPTFRQLVVNTCFGKKSQHKTWNRAYLSLPTHTTTVKTADISHANSDVSCASVSRCSIVATAGDASSSRINEQTASRTNSASEKKPALIAFSEDDTFV